MEQKKEVYDSERTVSLGQILFLIKKNLLLILIVVFTTTLLGAIYGFKLKKISYTANASVMVMDVGDTDNTQGQYQGYLLSNYLVNTFKEFILSDSVLEAVRSNPLITDTDIQTRTNITTTNYNLIIKISYTSFNKEQALLVVNELVKKSIEISNLKELDDSNKLVYKYTVLAEKLIELNLAQDENIIAKRGAALVIIISFVIGIFISFAIIIIKFLVDDTYRSKKVFEETYGISVLCVIPTYNQKGGKSHEK